MRVEFTSKIKLAAFERAHGRCEECRAFLVAGRFDYDHRIPCALGGDASIENCIVKCKSCHSSKTYKTDIPAIAKSKRIRKREAGIRKPRTMTRWRNMRGEIVTASRER